MVPKELSSSDWQQIAAAVSQFWLFAGILVVAALAFLIANATLPSLLATRQVPARLAIVRGPLNLIAAVAFVVALFVLFRATYQAWSVLREIYPRWWV